MIHDQKRVDAIRQHANERLKVIAEWEAKVSDPGTRAQLKLAKYGFSDIEDVFLSSLTRESRSPAIESRWLGYTEMAMQLAEIQLKPVLQILEKVGPNVTTVG